MGKKIFYILLVSLMMLSCSNGDDGVVSYWENGQVRSRLHYVDEKLDGLCTWYYSSGEKCMESNYSANKLNGETKRWYENGQLAEVSHYVDNQLDGVVEEYNVSGVLVKKSNYKNGVLEGSFTQWYDDGKLFTEGEYADGMMNGSWIMYYKDGSIGSNATYDHGTGVQYGYSEGGLYKNAMIHYKDNVKDGREYRYAIDGSVEKIMIWSKGEYLGNVMIDN